MQKDFNKGEITSLKISFDKKRSNIVILITAFTFLVQQIAPASYIRSAFADGGAYSSDSQGQMVPVVVVQPEETPDAPETDNEPVQSKLSVTENSNFLINTLSLTPPEEDSNEKKESARHEMMSAEQVMEKIRKEIRDITGSEVELELKSFRMPFEGSLNNAIADPDHAILPAYPETGEVRTEFTDSSGRRHTFTHSLSAGRVQLTSMEEYEKDRMISSESRSYAADGSLSYLNKSFNNYDGDNLAHSVSEGMSFDAAGGVSGSWKSETWNRYEPGTTDLLSSKSVYMNNGQVSSESWMNYERKDGNVVREEGGSRSFNADGTMSGESSSSTVREYDDGRLISMKSSYKSTYGQSQYFSENSEQNKYENGLLIQQITEYRSGGNGYSYSSRNIHDLAYNEAGNVTLDRYTYEYNGNPSSSSFTATFYDETGKLVLHIDRGQTNADGTQTIYGTVDNVYDSAGHLTESVERSLSNGQVYYETATRYEYDAEGHKVAETRTSTSYYNGGVNYSYETRETFNAAGKITSISNVYSNVGPDGLIPYSHDETKYEYADNGHLLRSEQTMFGDGNVPISRTIKNYDPNFSTEDPNRYGVIYYDYAMPVAYKGGYWRPWSYHEDGLIEATNISYSAEKGGAPLELQITREQYNLDPATGKPTHKQTSIQQNQIIDGVAHRVYSEMSLYELDENSSYGWGGPIRAMDTAADVNGDGRVSTMDDRMAVSGAMIWYPYPRYYDGGKLLTRTAQHFDEAGNMISSTEQENTYDRYGALTQIAAVWRERGEDGNYHSRKTIDTYLQDATGLEISVTRTLYIDDREAMTDMRNVRYSANGYPYFIYPPIYYDQPAMPLAGDVTAVTAENSMIYPRYPYYYRYNAIESLSVSITDAQTGESVHMTFDYRYDPATGSMLADITGVYSIDGKSRDISVNGYPVSGNEAQDPSEAILKIARMLAEQEDPLAGLREEAKALFEKVKAAGDARLTAIADFISQLKVILTAAEEPDSRIQDSHLDVLSLHEALMQLAFLYSDPGGNENPFGGLIEKADSLLAGLHDSPYSEWTHWVGSIQDLIWQMEDMQNVIHDGLTETEMALDSLLEVEDPEGFEELLKLYRIESEHFMDGLDEPLPVIPDAPDAEAVAEFLARLTGEMKQIYGAAMDLADKIEVRRLNSMADAELGQIFGPESLRFELTSGIGMESMAAGNIVDAKTGEVLISDYYIFVERDDDGKVARIMTDFQNLPAGDLKVLLDQLSASPDSPVRPVYGLNLSTRMVGIGGEGPTIRLYDFEALHEGRITLFYREDISYPYDVTMIASVDDGTQKPAPYPQEIAGSSRIRSVTFIVSDGPVNELIKTEGLIYLQVGQRAHIELTDICCGVEVQPRQSQVWLSADEARKIMASYGETLGDIKAVLSELRGLSVEWEAILADPEYAEQLNELRELREMLEGRCEYCPMPMYAEFIRYPGVIQKLEELSGKLEKAMSAGDLGMADEAVKAFQAMKENPEGNEMDAARDELARKIQEARNLPLMIEHYKQMLMERDNNFFKQAIEILSSYGDLIEKFEMTGKERTFGEQIWERYETRGDVWFWFRFQQPIVRHTFSVLLKTGDEIRVEFESSGGNEIHLMETEEVSSTADGALIRPVIYKPVFDWGKITAIDPKIAGLFDGMRKLMAKMDAGIEDIGILHDSYVQTFFGGFVVKTDGFTHLLGIRDASGLKSVHVMETPSPTGIPPYSPYFSSPETGTVLKTSFNVSDMSFSLFHNSDVNADGAVDTADINKMLEDLYRTYPWRFDYYLVPPDSIALLDESGEVLTDQIVSIEPVKTAGDVNGDGIADATDLAIVTAAVHLGEDGLERIMTEKLRTEMLSLVDGQIEELKERISGLEAALKEAVERTEIKIEEIRKEVQGTRQMLETMLAELTALGENEGLSDETRGGIRALAATLSSYLDPQNPEGLEMQMEGYYDALRKFAGADESAALYVERKYMEDLSEYRAKIAKAGSFEELQKLKMNPPSREIIVRIQVMPPDDPRENGQIERMREKGAALAIQARQEIHLWELEKMRGELLGRVASEKDRAETELVALEARLKQVLAGIEEQIAKVRAEAGRQAEELSRLKHDLESVLAQKGPDDDLRSRAAEFMNAVQALTEGGLEQQLEAYAHFMRERSPGVLKIRRAMAQWQDYLNRLAEYGGRLEKAPAEDVPLLAEEFPQFIIIYPRPVPMGPDGIVLREDGTTAATDIAENETGLNSQEVISDATGKVWYPERMILPPTYGLARMISQGTALLEEARAAVSAHVEKVRAEMLAGVDAMIEDIGSRITELEARLEELRQQTEADIERIRQEVSVTRGELKTLREELAALAGEAGLTEETREGLAGLGRELEMYLDPANAAGLDSQMEAYYENLRKMAGWDESASLYVEREYLKDMIAYRAQIAAAKTLEELEMLGMTLPGPVMLMRIQLAPPVDPRINGQIEAMHKRAEELMAKAREEMNAHHLEEIRRKLLARVSEASGSAKEALAGLEIEMTEAKARLAEEIAAFNQEKDALSGELQKLMDELSELISRVNIMDDGITPETRQMIADFLKKTGNYLDPNFEDGLEQDSRTYVGLLELHTLAPIRARMQSMTQYLADLDDFAHKVMAAGSEEELNQLGEQFPEPREFPLPKVMMVAPPTYMLKLMIEEGRTLHEQALEEMRLHQIIMTVRSTLALWIPDLEKVTDIEPQFDADGNLTGAFFAYSDNRFLLPLGPALMTDRSPQPPVADWNQDGRIDERDRNIIAKALAPFGRILGGAAGTGFMVRFNGMEGDMLYPSQKIRAALHFDFEHHSVIYPDGTVVSIEEMENGDWALTIVDNDELKTTLKLIYTGEELGMIIKTFAGIVMDTYPERTIIDLKESIAVEQYPGRLERTYRITAVENVSPTGAVRLHGEPEVLLAHWELGILPYEIFSHSVYGILASARYENGIEQAYDERGRLMANVSAGGKEVLRFHYGDAAMPSGAVLEKTLPDGSPTTIVFDFATHIARQTFQDGTAHIYTFEYDVRSTTGVISWSAGKITFANWPTGIPPYNIENSLTGFLQSMERKMKDGSSQEMDAAGMLLREFRPMIGITTADFAKEDRMLIEYDWVRQIATQTYRGEKTIFNELERKPVRKMTCPAGGECMTSIADIMPPDGHKQITTYTVHEIGQDGSYYVTDYAVFGHLSGLYHADGSYETLLSHHGISIFHEPDGSITKIEVKGQDLQGIIDAEKQQLLELGVTDSGIIQDAAKAAEIHASATQLMNEALDYLRIHLADEESDAAAIEQVIAFTESLTAQLMEIGEQIKSSQEFAARRAAVISDLQEKQAALQAQLDGIEEKRAAIHDRILQMEEEIRSGTADSVQALAELARDMKAYMVAQEEFIGADTQVAGIDWIHQADAAAEGIPGSIREFARQTEDMMLASLDEMKMSIATAVEDLTARIDQAAGAPDEESLSKLADVDIPGLELPGADASSFINQLNEGLADVRAKIKKFFEGMRAEVKDRREELRRRLMDEIKMRLDELKQVKSGISGQLSAALKDVDKRESSLKQKLNPDKATLQDIIRTLKSSVSKLPGTFGTEVSGFIEEAQNLLNAGLAKKMKDWRTAAGKPANALKAWRDNELKAHEKALNALYDKLKNADSEDIERFRDVIPQMPAPPAKEESESSIIEKEIGEDFQGKIAKGKEIAARVIEELAAQQRAKEERERLLRRTQNSLPTSAGYVRATNVATITTSLLEEKKKKK